MRVSLLIAVAALVHGVPAFAQDADWTLPQVVEAGLDGDPGTGAAAAALQSVEANLDEARAAYLPTLDTEASAGVRRLENATRRNLGIASEVLFPLEGSLQGDYTLVDFGRRDSIVAQQEALVSSARNRIEGAREQAALDIARQYVEVLLQEDILAVSRENVAGYSGLVRDLHGDVYATQYLNIAIAYGTVIENAVGSEYRDIIIANEYDNTLTGNGGDDVFIFLDGGNDTITDFESGSDLIDLSAFGIDASDVTIAAGALSADLDGDGAADLTLTFSNGAELQSADVFYG